MVGGAELPLITSPSSCSCPGLPRGTWRSCEGGSESCMASIWEDGKRLWSTKKMEASDGRGGPGGLRKCSRLKSCSVSEYRATCLSPECSEPLGAASEWWWNFLEYRYPQTHLSSISSLPHFHFSFPFSTGRGANALWLNLDPPQIHFPWNTNDDSQSPDPLNTPLSTWNNIQ